MNNQEPNFGQCQMDNRNTCDFPEARFQIDGAELLVKVIPKKGMLAEIKHYLSLVLPSLYQDEPLDMGVKRVVNRLVDVQKTVDHLSSNNENQAQRLHKIRASVESLGEGTTPLEERVEQVVQLVQKQDHVIKTLNADVADVNRAMDNADKLISEQLGVDTRYNGTIAQRIRELARSLRDALQANNMWAEAKPWVNELKINGELHRECEELKGRIYRQAAELLARETELLGVREVVKHLESEVATLRTDGSGGIYFSSVRDSHKLLDELGVNRSGSVSLRIRLFAGQVREALFSGSNRSTLWESVKNF